MPGPFASLSVIHSSPRELTSTVLGDPAHVRQQAIDVKVLAVKVSTLLFTEVSLLLQAGLGVAGFELHSPPYTVLPTIFWPEKMGNNRHDVLELISLLITPSHVTCVVLGKQF